MAEINEWQTVAGNNNDAPPDGFPENMPYSDVNNSSREVMAVLARAYQDTSGALDSTGTDDIVINTTGTYSAYFQGLNIGFRAGGTNTGPMTIQLNALPAVGFVNTAGGPMQASSIVQGLVYFAVFNGSQFQLISNGFTFPGGNPGLFSAALPTVTPALDDRIPLTDTSDGSAPKFADVQDFLTLTTSPYTLTDPPAVPEGVDRFPFQDVSDGNARKIATLAQIIDAGNVLFRTNDASETPALGDLVSFQDVSDSNAARTAPVTDLLAAAYATAASPAIDDVISFQDTSNSNLFRTSTIGNLFNAFGTIREVQFRTLTVSGTYAKPTNLVAALVIVIGGGGGGGGTVGPGDLPSNRIEAGAGGLSGAMALRIYTDAELAASTTYTVGAGGAGGTPVSGSSFEGGDGGISRFNIPVAGTGPAIDVGGGQGGSTRGFSTSFANTSFIQSSSTVATASGGVINLSARAGSPGMLAQEPVNAVGGNGGDSLFGSGGRGGNVIASTTAENGSDATGFGAGGGGGAAFNTGLGVSATGGDGAQGAVIVIEFRS